MAHARTLLSSARPLTVAALLLASGSAANVVLGDFSWANPHIHQPLLDLLPPGQENARAIQSGPWSDPQTWGGTLPAPGDDVLIPAGVTVIYDVFDDGDREGPDVTRLHTLRVDGELRWATDRDTALYLDTLLSSPSGVISIGDESAPLPADRRAEIVIIADEPMDFSADPEQLGRGVVPHGVTRIVGADKTDFAALAGDALAGATSLTLREAPSGWRIGDRLVLGGTSYDEAGDDALDTRFQDEVLRVTSIKGNIVSFVTQATGAGLRFDHVRPNGAHFDPEDLNLYVANLSRNIVLRSELDPASPQASAPPVAFPGGVDEPVPASNFQRGHLMVMHNPDTIIRNAQILDFGRSFKSRFVDEPAQNLDGSPGAGANQRGRYSLHLHRNLPGGDQPIDLATATPAQVSGTVIWGSPGWAFVHHDSYAVFEDNVAFDIVGSGFVQEAGNEIGRWSRNISIKTTGDDNPEMTVEPFGEGAFRVARFDFGFNGEGYWIQGAGQVAFENNIAISAAGGGAQLFSQVDGLGDQRDRQSVPVEHLRPEIQHIVTRDDGLIDVSHVPFNTFRGFEVYNSDFGLITWGHMRNQGEWIGFTCPCDGIAHRERSVIEDFAFWNIYGQGIHLQYTSQVDLTRGLVASRDLATPGVDDKPDVSLGINGEGRGFGIGMNGPAKRLHVSDVAIEGWTYGLRTPLEGQINELDDGVGTGSEGAIGLPLRASRFTDLKMAGNDHHLFRRQNGFTDPQPFSNWLEIRGGDFEPGSGNIPPVADFTAEPTADTGVVTLSGMPSFDTDTPTGPSNGSNVVAVSDPNNIVSYAWDLDGDGEPDRYGENVNVRLPRGRSTPVTLTVWDHQGLTDTITLPVTPGAIDPPELLLDGGFDGELQGGIYSLNSAEASTGWFDARANIVSGQARLAGQFRFSSIAQAIYDDFASRGEHTLVFDLGSFEAEDGSHSSEINEVVVRVFGINGEFGSSHRDAQPIPYSAIPVEIDLLFEEAFVGDVPTQRFERTVDLGESGYRYLYVGFEGTGLNGSLPDDFATVDNVSLTGSQACPADLTGDGRVDAADLSNLISAWGRPGPSDLDGDGVVGSSDLTLLVASWGPCN